MAKQVNCERCFEKDRYLFAAVGRDEDGRALCLPCVRAEELDVDTFEFFTAAEPVSLPAVVVQATKQTSTEGVRSMKEKHQCACGTPLHAKAIKLGKCKACRDAEKGKGIVAKKASKAATVPSPDGGATRKTTRREKPVLVTDPPVEDPRVEMSVTARFLENAWLKLPLELKAVAIAAALQA